MFTSKCAFLGSSVARAVAISMQNNFEPKFNLYRKLCIL